MSGKSTEEEEKAPQPQLPENWDRCHAYNEKKRRYCRQMPAPNQNYCGNHLHLIQEGDCDRNKRPCDDVDSSDVKRSNKKRKDRGARIPCPIDPSHLIFESALSKHVLVCPAAKERAETCSREYYREGTNTGGHGDLGDDGNNNIMDVGGEETTDLERAKQLAMAVLKVFCSVFPSTVARSNIQNKDEANSDGLSDDVLKHVTEEDIYNALPEVDLSSAEEGIAKDIAKHRVKAGGPRHLHQLQSILGHVRKSGMIPTADDDSEQSVIEMGAGRGMLGLVTASAIGAAQTQNAASSKVKLYLVERSGTRGKAETKIRTATGDASQGNDSLRLDRVEVSRIKCDLAHVHMSTALPFLTKESEKCRSIVVAKHLCGAGTDLALKSLRDVVQSGAVDGCVMATCCHGLCTWKDYVGRDCFLELFRGVAGVSTFAGSDFDQLRRWTSASVLEDSDHTRSAVVDDDEHNIGVKSQNIYLVVKELGLACGGRGLGRACQRLIDYGRTEYIREHFFHSKGASPGKQDCITTDPKEVEQSTFLHRGGDASHDSQRPKLYHDSHQSSLCDEEETVGPICRIGSTCKVETTLDIELVMRQAGCFCEEALRAL